ncbi:MAG TPA: hypothetical protein VKG79_02645 [Bryobacteraceae bacterium]|nr:hypothetical protein [Bryobacteraceae bacterium]
MFNVTGLVEEPEAIGEAFDVGFRKNEAIIGRVPGNCSVFVEFEEGGGVLKIAAFALGAGGLDFAEGVEGFLELAGEALALDAEVGDEAMGVDDVEVDAGLFGGRVGCAAEEAGFEERDAVETPGGVDQFVDEVGFGGGCRLVFVEESAAVGFEGGRVFGGEQRGCGGEAVAESVQRGALFAGFGAGSGGVLGVRAVDGCAMAPGAS